MKKHNFKANIRLKDIIGQGLITNSNIAIIELIKNARDAKSSRVNVIFENANSKSGTSRIIIQDFGHGMDLNDIAYKWLNIAYSEKRIENKKGDQVYAGEKGIGRFSCDRLGRSLNLYTKKKIGNLIHLAVDWREFEIDDRDKEISSVDLIPKTIKSTAFKKKTNLNPFDKGTCLIIEDLKETWGINELNKLQKVLERFIIDPKEKFKVFLKSTDIKDGKGRLVFNGIIKNRLLTRLDDKTISIHSKITNNGKTIKTELSNYGDIILSFEEDNPYTQLKDVRAQIHYLNPGGKISFKNITGFRSADYGSIMFFLNGFRVMPYGDPKDDWLGLNQRKAQGGRRFFGTREIFGIVEAYDNSRKLLPVSSREGLEDNLAFKQLTNRMYSDKVSGYLPGVLRILERYVVEGIDWDRAAPKDGEFSLEEVTNALQAVLESHKKNKSLRNLKINNRAIKEIAKEKIIEYKNFINELLESVSGKSVYELSPSEKKNLAKYVRRHDSALDKKTETNREYKEAIEVERKRRLFAESHQTSDEQRVTYLQHQVGIISGKLVDDLYKVLKKHSNNQTQNVEDLIEVIKKSHFNASQINKLSQIITKANFDIMSNNIRHDIFTYIEQYIKDMCENGADWGLEIEFSNSNNAELVLNMRPIQVSMLVDNVLSNSEKSDAKNVEINVSEDKKSFQIEFIDDGKGLSDKYKPEVYFNAGISTTKGSGIGLSHVKQIVKELDGSVSISNNDEKGATIKVWWKK